MSRSRPLTKAALGAQAHEFRSFERLLELELDGLALDPQYELLFSRLVKPDPFRLFGVEAPGELPFMLGTDQRDYLVPLLARELARLGPEAHVLDVGAGDGLTTASALEGRREPLALLPLDPAEGALERYRDRFDSSLPQIAIPRLLVGGIDGLVSALPGSELALTEPLDAVLAIHTLYFSEDLPTFLRFAHDRLVPGGRMVITFAVAGGLFTGRLARDYWQSHPDPGPATRHDGASIDRLFGLLDESAGPAHCEAALVDHLGDDLFSVVELVRQPTRIFGHDLGDLIAAAFVTGLGSEEPAELRRQIQYVSRRIQEEPETFDLRLMLDGPRARMLSIAQPQTFLVLERR